ncbi:type IV pilus assembly protein PilM [Candidatus Microgenomates bacterium]|nr:type IV pilus assembly protein PilM [Candidatus Microgenomates bacterium]
MSTFGLDIGSHSIKVIQLAREGKNVRLLAAGVASSPPKGMSSEADQDLLQVSEVIKKLVTDAKINTREVVFALPEPLVFTRLISFPPLSDEEVNSAVEWQAEGYIPVPKKDAVLDHEIVRRTDKGIEVLLVATPRKAVDKYMKVVRGAGLTSVAIETELIALTRSIAPAGKTALVIDFGAASTDVAVSVDKQVMFTRSIPVGGQALTRAVATGIGVEATQAEEYKRTYGLTASLEGKVKQALTPLVSSLLGELKKAVGFWQQEHNSSPVEVVVLTGGTAGLPEIAPSITASLGVEVTIGNPFGAIVRDPRVAQNLDPYAPLYAIAVGLALRGV